MNPLVRLGASELRALAAAAVDGRLNPATPGLVGRYVSDGAAVSRALTELAASGVALGPTLALLAEAAERRSAVEDLVELVVTGPNTGTGRDTGVVVRQLFREARKSVWVCGYNLYNARDLFADLVRPELRVRMLLDIGEADGQSEVQAVRRFLDDFRRWHWPDGQALPEIWYDPLSLLPKGEHRAVAHAKCVVADERYPISVFGELHRGGSESKSGGGSVSGVRRARWPYGSISRRADPGTKSTASMFDAG
jgi:hypothetical protein